MFCFVKYISLREIRGGCVTGALFLFQENWIRPCGTPAVVYDLDSYIEFLTGKTELSMVEALAAARTAEALISHKMNLACVRAVYIYDSVLCFKAVDLRTAGGIEISFQQSAGDRLEGELRSVYHDPSSAVIFQREMGVVDCHAPYLPSAAEQ